MAINASGARVRYAYVTEVTPGTTPSTPSFTMFPVTGGNMSATKSASPIKNVYPDRQFRDAPQTMQGAAGSYNIAMAYGQFDDIMQGAMFGTWASNALKDSTTRNFLTFEETEDVGGGSFLYSRYPMGIVDGFGLDMTGGREVTGSFSVWAQKETKATTIITGATYTAAVAKPVLSAGVSFASLSLLSLSSPKVRRVTINIKNSMRARPVVDSLYSIEPGEDMADISGTVEIYVDSNSAMQKALDHATGALSFNLGNTAGSTYTFNMPNIQTLEGKRSNSGPSGDGMVTIPFQALRDSGTSAQLVITRAV